MAGSTDSILTVDNVTKRYGKTVAVEGVSLSVRKGEFLTLLGPSGSGKTTLLMMIAGFVDPSEGHIFFFDRRITALPPEQRNLGMVFQSYALFPHLSVQDNVAFPLRIRKLDGNTIQQQVRRALDLVQLADLAHRKPRELSGGQQQRVALARALSYNPDILLLDEPLGALDRKLRADVQVELKQLHRRVNRTFLYVTHDQEEALSMSDRIAIFRNGRIVQVGTARDLYEQPSSRFVADFLGSSNFFKGRVKTRNGASVTIDVNGRSIVHTVRPGDRFDIDDEVLMALRPERVAISLVPDDRSPNRLSGVVGEWNYFGTNLRIAAEIEGIGKFLAVTPAWNAQIAPHDGQTIYASWAPDAGVIVRDDS